MDERAIFARINETVMDMKKSSCDQLMGDLDCLKHVRLRDKKDTNFQERIKFICLANSFDIAMRRDYQCQQMKRFLKKHAGFDEERAKTTALKLNEARRVYPRLDKIVQNCCSCRYVDIRTLSIHELYLANSLSWVLNRNAENDPLTRLTRSSVPLNITAVKVVDAASVEETVKHIMNSAWYKKACHDPNLVAYIMSQITAAVVNDSKNMSKK